MGLENLNERQRQAACHGQTPLLIVAGAGSGKTTTLVHRVAYLIDKGIAPQQILLLTFTRRAATEMLQRVERIVPQRLQSRRIWGGTFHAMGTRLLRTFGEAIDVNPRFTIHDRGDSEDLMRALVTESKLSQDDKRFPKKGTCISIHSYCANSRQSLDEVLKSRFFAYFEYAAPLERLFHEYAARKKELAVFDYDDLLLKWYELLGHHEVGGKIRDRFERVLVDEYQDTNRLQAELLRRLCPDGMGLSVVGDDAQSIYSFRAATVSNILDFPKHYPKTTVVTLDQNYRSTRPLLDASNQVMAEAHDGYEKKLWSQREEGPLPQLITCCDEDEQTDFVVHRIQEHKAAGVPLRQQAVLFRAAHHSIMLEAELARQDLPFVKYGGLKFVESAHVKDMIGFLRLVENRHDLIAGIRVLRLLPGIGPKKAHQLMAKLAECGGQFSCWETVKAPAKSAELWPSFVATMHELANDKADDVQSQLDRALQFYGPLMEEKYENPMSRENDLVQLVQIAARFPDRTSFLTDLAIDPPTSEADLPLGRRNRDHLVLSTLHSAKGLEWQVVYVLHASDGMIPYLPRLENAEQLEEERRMFYVALTRAADWLYVCYAENHWQPQHGRWQDWDDDGYRELTRFVTPRVEQVFQCQRASQFEINSP